MRWKQIREELRLLRERREVYILHLVQNSEYFLTRSFDGMKEKRFVIGRRGGRM